MRSLASVRNSEKGVALIFVLLAMIVLTGLGIAFAIQSNVEYQISENYVTHQEALAIADSGFNIAKGIVQRTDFNALLGQETDVAAYAAGDAPSAGSLEVRNAIATRAARNVDFNSPPTPYQTYKARGILTPANGFAYANGRYFAKVTNNTFGGAGSIFGKDTDPNVDTDSTLLLRVTGIRPTLANEKITGTKIPRNSVAVIEAMLKRNTSFNLSSPLTINGPSTDATFNGNKFYVDGYNHDGMTRAQIEAANHEENSVGAGPGLAAINDNPGGGDAATVAQALYDLLQGNKEDNVVGVPGIHVDDTPSVADITGLLRSSSDPDVAQILNPDFICNFVTKLTSFADDYYGESQDFSGGNIQMGTRAAPKISYFNQGLTVSGSGTGAGILVVRGAFEIGGAFEYDGVVLVVGDGSINFHGAEEGFIGGVYVQKVTTNESGHCASGQSTVKLNGNSDFYFSGEMIKMAINLLPMKMLEWREITPEISK